MQRIVVKDFGPLKDIDLEIKDYMVFIGPNASGKSTLANLLHFFQLIPAKLVEVLLDSFGDRNFNPDWIAYRSTFIYYNQYFPEKIKSTYVQFYYSKKLKIELDFSKNSGSSTPLPFEAIFSNELKSLIIDLYNLKTFFEDKLELENSNKDFKSNTFLNVKGLFQKEIERIIDGNLNNLANSSKILIPENRSGINDGQWGNQIKSSTFYLQNFLNENQSFPIVILDILKGSPKEISKNDLGIISENGDFFRYQTLSSGQRNAFWLALVLFEKSLIDFAHNHIIIEEPETHLFPDSQKLLTELITKLANQLNNQVVITTHSHYILGTINILLNAHRIGQIHPKKVNELIEKDLWIDKENFFAGYLDNGVIKDIFDNEAEMLEIADLNKVAGELNEVFDKLFEIEFESENAN